MDDKATEYHIDYHVLEWASIWEHAHVYVNTYLLDWTTEREKLKGRRGKSGCESECISKYVYVWVREWDCIKKCW